MEDSKIKIEFKGRDTLIRQASLDRAHNEYQMHNSAQKSRNASIVQNRSDEEIELIWPNDENKKRKIGILLSSEERSLELLTKMLNYFQSYNINLIHLETRQKINKQGTNEKCQCEIFVMCEGLKKDFVEVIKNMNDTDWKFSMKIFNTMDDKINNAIWCPLHISQLDDCCKCIVKYDPTMDPRHPGFGDQSYINRRTTLNRIAAEYKHNQTLPDIEYTQDEQKTWRNAYMKLKDLHETHACWEYIKNLAEMEKDQLFTPNRIPSLSKVNDYLHKKTGFTLRPCQGLLSARDFLASLAFRVFQTTLYVRHSGSPHYSPEPDLIHEFLGHCPMLADPFLAQLSQEIGLLSLGASDEQIEQLATVYWFIIEFGLCSEGKKYRAIGAGLLSSYGELMHACSDKVEHVPFDPKLTALQVIDDSDYQQRYFVADSIKEAIAKLKAFALQMGKMFIPIYDPITQTVKPVTELKDLINTIDRFKNDLCNITDAVHFVSKSSTPMCSI